MLRRREASLPLATSAASNTFDVASLAKMFISSMARRNAESKKKLESRRREMKRKDVSLGLMANEGIRSLRLVCFK